MKNTIPLIIAIVLGLIAVFAVSRMIRPAESEKENSYEWVVAAVRDITPKDGPVKESWLQKRRVEKTSMPSKAIPWKEIHRVTGQEVVHTIARNDYILASDVAGLDIRLDAAVGEGEWAVPVTFSDPSLVQFLQPGMEVAILGTSVLKEIVKKTDASEKPDVVEQRATSVIFPCVRILDIGRGDAIRRNDENGASGTIIVALTPQQSATLVAAQRTMELYPALRRPNDPNALKRRDVGMVTDATFKSLRSDLTPISMQDVNFKK